MGGNKRREGCEGGRLSPLSGAVGKLEFRKKMVKAVMDT